MPSLPKIIAIVGPTSSGKTRLGLELAKRYNGEIISADSRQLYKKMTIGTAKPQGEWRSVQDRRAYIVEGVPHYMMDIVDPGHQMSLAEFKSDALSHINDIIRRGRLPIIVGGTGLYIQAIVDNLEPPKIPPNKILRRSFEKRSLQDLLTWLQKLDPESYASVDIKNPRRVIRALEVAILSGESFADQRKQADALFDVLQIGLRREPADLARRIESSVDQQIEGGLEQETRSLVKQKYGWNLPSMSSIGYKQMGEYLAEKCTKERAIEVIKQATRKYAKRQMTWFKRDKRIIWLGGDETAAADKLVKDFILR
ncbi:MAG: tRNA (adenosine(37)-N6)-dimethylallyltransferase MiaA [Candidatus Magasanikbacteria bacterium RIFCSPLOWO2_02_FULL_44_11]|uniref:tRNA dimethylallyltransferase n=1 Tax=Candidatus Magasanikbacteria bacterium RIFCSPLOWO2_02_FULL_44_11 TaxID=1798689 RepID=A0A1F6N985_9BACT|nr:MAG: tRNA (adenosine(37)-N6)-dimethylallyltransferase MiaA [Candidatus Magasanikbacteria bacterium RIFCSPLOWO2_02_FULL_44_11]